MAEARKIGLACSIVLLLTIGLCSFLAARIGVSGLIAELGQSEADRWPARKHLVPMGEIGRVAGFFADSLDFAANNPWALEGIGVLNLERMRRSRVATDAEGFARDARARFAKGLFVRPASPFLWANLALSKVYLDEIDVEFRSALKNADELGPWEPASQQVALFAGLAAWDKLDEAERRILEGILERGAQRNGRRLYEIVKTYRRLDLICRIKGYDSLTGQECARREEPPKPSPGTKAKR